MFPPQICEYEELVHRRKKKQLVALILQSGAVEPLQEKRAQQSDVIKRAPVKPRKHDGNMAVVAGVWTSLTPVKSGTEPLTLA